MDECLNSVSRKCGVGETEHTRSLPKRPSIPLKMRSEKLGLLESSYGLHTGKDHPKKVTFFVRLTYEKVTFGPRPEPPRGLRQRPINVGLEKLSPLEGKA